MEIRKIGTAGELFDVFEYIDAIDDKGNTVKVQGGIRKVEVFEVERMITELTKELKYWKDLKTKINLLI